MQHQGFLRTLIIIPTYNERENLPLIAHRIFELDEKIRSEVLPDLLVVDDGSPDGTGQVADALAQKYPGRCNVLHRAGKLGLGTAYVEGFRWGLSRGYDALIEMDADFSHDPAYLPEMVRALRNADFVMGSRYVPGGGTKNWGLGRRILSRGGSLYARTILRAPYRDFTGGFVAWKRKVLESIGIDSLRSDGYSFQIELKYRAYRLGFHGQEMPIVFVDREVGKSKMSRKIVIEALGRVWKLPWEFRKHFLGLESGARQNF